jgi:hypothetical protein
MAIVLAVPPASLIYIIPAVILGGVLFIIGLAGVYGN